MTENNLHPDKLVADSASPKEKSLRAISRANIERIVSEFIQKAIAAGYASNADSLHVEILAEATEMAKNYFYSINLTTASIKRLIETGKIETIWDHPNVHSLQDSAEVNNKSLRSDYLDTRRAAEDGLRQFVQVSAEINPIFAALAATKEDMIEGAAPRYGNWAVFISPTPEMEEKIVFSAEDSFRSVDSKTLEFTNNKILNLQHAFLAVVVHKKFFNIFLDSDSKKRIHRLRNYVEAAIFDSVTLEKVSKIVCTLSTKEEVETAREILDVIGPIKDKVQFVFDGEVGTQTQLVFGFAQ